MRPYQGATRHTRALELVSGADEDDEGDDEEDSEDEEEDEDEEDGEDGEEGEGGGAVVGAGLPAAAAAKGEVSSSGAQLEAKGEGGGGHDLNDY